jgi:ankyrin repeat protein
MQTLLDDGLEPNFKKNKRPIIQRSIGYGNKKVVEILLHRGAFVDTTNEKGQNSIVYAVKKGEDSIAAYLIEEGRYQNESNRVTTQQLEELIVKRETAKT